jgi:hypothetical protein
LWTTKNKITSRYVAGNSGNQVTCNIYIRYLEVYKEYNKNYFNYTLKIILSLTILSDQ